MKSAVPHGHARRVRAIIRLPGRNKRMASPDLLDYGLDGDVWFRQYRRSVRMLPGVQAALSYFQHLFELAPIAFVVTDPQLYITDANRQAARLLNRSLGGVRGK